MEGSVAQQIQNAAGVMLRAVRSPGSNIAANLNLCLNQFLTWPFKAGPASITDTEGNNTKFDSVIFTSSQGTTEDKPVNINVDAVACATYVVDSLGRDELFAGYKRIAALKSLKRSPAPNIRYPINTSPLGIIFTVDSTMPIEDLAELIILQNKEHPSTLWPDMVVVLSKGTVNYIAQVHGDSSKNNFVLPSRTFSKVPPMYIYVMAQGLGLFSMNSMCGLLFMHLLTFSPGTSLPTKEVVLEGVSQFGITVGAYQLNLQGKLVPVTNDFYSARGLIPLPFRIEDSDGTLLSHLEFIPWQDGGVVRLTGQLPLDGILVFLGPVAKNAEIIKQSDGAISTVLPIGQTEFRNLLGTFQRQSNMNVKPEEPRWIISKVSDEGTSSPHMARLSLGILRLRDVVFPDDNTRDAFDKAFEFAVMTLFNARTTAKEIIETITDHRRKVSLGEAAKLDGYIIRVNESIDAKLQTQVAEFFNISVRVLKDGMQKLSGLLKLNIGILYIKQGALNKGIKKLKKTNPDLADYLEETRKWSEQLILIRNNLHEGWVLPKMEYHERLGTIDVEEPQISDQSTTEFVNYMIDRLCCFVEEITIHALQVQMPSGISVTEIPISERNPDCRERFQLTFIKGGKQIWTLKYHVSRFEET